MDVSRGVEKLRAANHTLHFDLDRDIDHHVMNFTTAENIRIVVMRPHQMEAGVDWRGSGFGVSTQCSAVPKASCVMGTLRTGKPDYLQRFACIIDHKTNVSGILNSDVHSIWFSDWHLYVKENRPFNNTPETGTFLGPNFVERNLTWDDANSMFRNPWHWLSEIGVTQYKPDVPVAFADTTFQWDIDGYESLKFLLWCNTTGT